MNKSALPALSWRRRRTGCHRCYKSENIGYETGIAFRMPPIPPGTAGAVTDTSPVGMGRFVNQDRGLSLLGHSGLVPEKRAKENCSHSAAGPGKGIGTIWDRTPGKNGGTPDAPIMQKSGKKAGDQSEARAEY